MPPLATTMRYPAELQEHFDMDRAETIGTGGFAKVKKAKHCLTGETVAIKMMDKVKLRESGDLERVATEIAALKELNHQHISQLYFVHETETHVYMVLEYARGGELFDHIVARGRCSENETRGFFREIVTAVGYCHAHGIAHRDLKPENILLDHNRRIKLIDFGLVAKPSALSTDLLTTCCGSTAYAAPELVRGEKYIGPKVDMWSLGILLYALLCGFLPFDDDSQQRTSELIERGRYEIPAWMSHEAEKLICKLLKHNPDHRLTMLQLQKQSWLVKGSAHDKIDSSSTRPPRDQIEPSVLTEMAKFYGIDAPTMKVRINEWNYDEVTLNYQLLLLRHRKDNPMRLAATRAHSDLAMTTPDMAASPTAISPVETLSTGTSTTDLSPTDWGSLPAGMDSMAVAQSILSRGRVQPDFGAHGSPLAGVDGLGSTTSLDRTAGERTRGDSLAQTLQDRRERRRHSAHSAGCQPTKTRTLDLIKDDPARGSLAMHGRREGSGSLPDSLNAPARRPAKSKSRFSGLSFFGSRESLTRPRTVKGLFNVKTTSPKAPDAVKAEVLRVLTENGYVSKVKGYIITVKIFAAGSKSKVDMQIKFEVCLVDGIELTGIALSRVMGDTWAFKKEVDTILERMKL
eukprot:m.331083 g.331083  ORF g.331083 m.331083 type:complete len:631 (+) comp27723_c0_seq15:1146-3038(+)